MEYYLRVVDSDAATFSSSNIAFHKDINMNEGLITNLRRPENDNDATSKKYVDSLIGTNAPNEHFISRQGRRDIQICLFIGTHTSYTSEQTSKYKSNEN